MKKGSLRKILSTVLASLMIFTTLSFPVSAEAEPTQEELEAVFKSFAPYCYIFGKYFTPDEAVSDEVVYQIVNNICWGGGYDEYRDDSEYDPKWIMPYDVFMSIVDGKFVNHSDMKSYLTEKGCYDEATGNVTVAVYGGVGDVWAWVPLSIFNEGSDYYVQGLFLNGNEDTGAVTEGMIENIDYYNYSFSYEDENGETQTVTSKMYIDTPVELKLVNTGDGLKIAGYYKVGYYIIDHVLYNEGAMYYPINITGGDGVTLWADKDNGIRLEDTLTVMNGKLWRESTQAVAFTAEIAEGHELRGMTYRDKNGSGEFPQLSNGTYHIIPSGALDINIDSGKETVTLDGGNGVIVTIAGDKEYYSSMSLVADEPAEGEGDRATELVISSIGGEAKALAYDIRLESDGEECQPKEGDEVTVTLPIPEGWSADGIVIYHVSDDGVLTDMNAVVSGDGKTVSFTTTHFSIYVIAQKTKSKGDVNGDGKITAADAIAILRYNAGWYDNLDTLPIDPDAGDVTGDGKTNVSDAVYIMRYIAKWAGYTL